MTSTGPKLVETERRPQCQLNDLNLQRLGQSSMLNNRLKLMATSLPPQPLQPPLQPLPPTQFVPKLPSKLPFLTRRWIVAAECKTTTGTASSGRA